MQDITRQHYSQNDYATNRKKITDTSATPQFTLGVHCKKGKAKKSAQLKLSLGYHNQVTPRNKNKSKTL